MTTNSSGKLKYSIILNVSLSFLVTLAFLWVIREIGNTLTAASLGVFLLSRRIVDAVSNALQLGTAQAVRRYVAMFRTGEERIAYVVACLVVILVASGLLIVTLAASLPFWTSLVFLEGGEGANSVMLLIGVASAATVLGFVANSLLLALNHIKLANLMDLLNASGWLLIAVWLLGRTVTVEILLAAQAGGTVLVSAAVLGASLVKGRKSGLRLPSFATLRASVKEVIGYGALRTLAPFLETALILVGPWLIREKVEEAGYLIIALTILRLGRMVVQPAAIVIGIAVAVEVGAGGDGKLRVGMPLLLGTMLYFSVALFAVLVPWSPFLVGLWLGDPTLVEGVLLYTTVTLIALPAATITQALREPIDMIWKAPLNVYNYIVCILAMVLFYIGTVAYLGISISIASTYVFGYWLNFAISAYFLRGYLQRPGYYAPASLAVLLLVTYALNSYLADTALTMPTPWKICLLAGGAIAPAILLLLGTRWLHHVQLFRDLRHYLALRN